MLFKARNFKSCPVKSGIREYADPVPYYSDSGAVFSYFAFDKDMLVPEQEKVRGRFRIKPVIFPGK